MKIRYRFIQTLIDFFFRLHDLELEVKHGRVVVSTSDFVSSGPLAAIRRKDRKAWKALLIRYRVCDRVWGVELLADDGLGGLRHEEARVKL